MAEISYHPFPMRYDMLDGVFTAVIRADLLKLTGYERL